jgi:Flp pilus assembly protein TadG
MTRLHRYLHADEGAVAAEFVLVLPFVLVFVWGAIHLGMLFYTATQLHWATEDAARCASIRSDCKSAGVATPALVQSWAADRYNGLAPATFTYTADGACSQTTGTPNGHKVVGVAIFKFYGGIFYKDVTVNAKACYA